MGLLCTRGTACMLVMQGHMGSEEVRDWSVACLALGMLTYFCHSQGYTHVLPVFFGIAIS